MIKSVIEIHVKFLIVGQTPQTVAAEDIDATIARLGARRPTEPL